MAAQSLLAKLGMRAATLGTAASLAIAAPLANNDTSMAAHTDASRIGWYFDRTGGAEKIGHVVMGTDSFSVGATGIAVPGTVAIGQATAAYKVDVLVAGNDGIRVANGSNQIYLGTTAAVAAVGTLTSDPFSVITSGAVSISVAATGKSTFVASSTSRASINLPHGTAPTVPVDGDFWSATAGFFGQVNGATVGPFAAGGGGTIGGTIADESAGAVFRLAYSNGTDIIQGTANITYDPTRKMLVSFAAVNEYDAGTWIQDTSGGNDNSVGITLISNTGYSASNNGVLYLASNNNTNTLFGDAGANMFFVGKGYIDSGVDSAGMSVKSNKLTLGTAGVSRLAVLADGGTQWTGITTASSPAVSAADNGVIFFDKTLQKFRVSQNTGAYADLVGGGVTTMSAIGATPNANGATISGVTLNLEPASASFGGVVTTGTQVFSGFKTISGASGTQFEIQNSSDGARGLRLACITGTGARISTQSGIYPLILGQDGGNHLTISIGGTVFIGADPGGSQTFRVGGTVLASGKITGPAATTGTATFNAPHGTAPTTPVDGDLWTTTGGFFGQVNGGTVGPFIGGTLVSGRMIYANGAGSVTTSSKMLYDDTTGFNVNMASSGSNNLTLGTSAGDSLSSGAQNTLVGVNAGTALTTISDITAVGYNALAACTSADNTAIGSQAGQTLTGSSRNVAIGGLALSVGASGVNDNTAVGHQSLRFCTGVRNSAVGSFSANALSSSDNVTAVGYNALGVGSTGISNSTAVGHAALSLATGLRNTAIGASAGAVTTTGTDNIFIGAFAGDATANSASNRCVIGSGTSSISSVFIGNGEVNAAPTAITINATGGAGTNISGAALTIAGGVGTGTGIGGSLIFQTALAGGSGSSQNALVTALTIDQKANLVLGTAALATGATDGFLYIPTCAGTPSGAPTAFTGRSPIIYDTTANKLWVYNGSWRGIVLV